MKIFISADMEGCAGVVSWSETELNNTEHERAAREMTLEVKAVCETLFENGVSEITVKDAHESGKNIFYEELPKGVKIVRSWTGSPYSMVQGLDETYDGAIFIGYHSAASMEGSPLSHTMNLELGKIIINDMVCSEYLLHAYAAADLGVPVIMISGDRMICEWAEKFNNHISIAPLKEGVGGGVISLSQVDALELIKIKTVEALKNMDKCKIEIPEKFDVSIEYKKHEDAYRVSYYPGVEKTSSREVSYSTDNIKDMLITNMFIL
jgi:D-amino peptidase